MNTGVGSHSLLQGIFLVLLHGRQILYRLNHQGDLFIHLGAAVEMRGFPCVSVGKESACQAGDCV